MEGGATLRPSDRITASHSLRRMLLEICLACWTWFHDRALQCDEYAYSFHQEELKHGVGAFLSESFKKWDGFPFIIFINISVKI